MDTLTKRGTIYVRESFAEAWEEAKSLAQANFDEMNRSPELTFQPIVSLYERLEKIGLLRIYIARIDGVMFGYRSLVLVRHEHSQELVAKCDALYVSPEHRGWPGVRLMRHSDRELAREGVTKVYQSSQIGELSIDRFLSASGYEPIEILYSRKLTKEQT